MEKVGKLLGIQEIVCFFFFSQSLSLKEKRTTRKSISSFHSDFVYLCPQITITPSGLKYPLLLTIISAEVDLYKHTVTDRSCWERLQPHWKPDYIMKSNRHKSRDHPGKVIKECILAQISIQLVSRCKHVLEYSLEASFPPCWKLLIGLMVQEAVLKDELRNVAGTDKA